MATEKQKEAARRTRPGREARRASAPGKDIPSREQEPEHGGKDKLADEKSAFPEERQGPLADARHVRNAIARFNPGRGRQRRGAGRGVEADPVRGEALRRRSFRIRLARPGQGRQGPQALGLCPLAAFDGPAGG